MGDIGDFFREQKEYIKEKRQEKNDKYEPQLISMGAIKKSCAVYEFGDWLCYPTKGFAMNKKNVKERMGLDKFIKIIPPVVNIKCSDFPLNQDTKRCMCFEKKAYSSEKFANKVKADLEAKRDIKLRVYQCPICSFYHLTSKSEDEYANV